MFRKLVVTCVAATLGVVGLPMVAAQAATTPVRVGTASSATAYNGGTVRVYAKASIAGPNRVITSKSIHVYKHGKAYKNGTSVTLKSGTYREKTFVHWHSYYLSTRHRIVRVAHEGDYASARCVVKTVEDGYDTDDTCTSSYYPGEVVHTAYEVMTTARVGEKFTAEEYFDTVYVNTRQAYKVRVYHAMHHYYSPVRTLTVHDGGFRRVFTGEDSATTISFHIPKGSWHVNYVFNCGDFPGNFILDAEDGYWEDEQFLANDLDYYGANTTYVHQGGTWYLEIISECAWQITVRA